MHANWSRNTRLAAEPSAPYMSLRGCHLSGCCHKQTGNAPFCSWAHLDVQVAQPLPIRPHSHQLALQGVRTKTAQHFRLGMQSRLDRQDMQPSAGQGLNVWSEVLPANRHADVRCHPLLHTLAQHPPCTRPGRAPRRGGPGRRPSGSGLPHPGKARCHLRSPATCSRRPLRSRPRGWVRAARRALPPKRRSAGGGSRPGPPWPAGWGPDAGRLQRQRGWEGTAERRQAAAAAAAGFPLWCRSRPWALQMTCLRGDQPLVKATGLQDPSKGAGDSGARG